jgi:hypothetical protein
MPQNEHTGAPDFSKSLVVISPTCSRPFPPLKNMPGRRGLRQARRARSRNFCLAAPGAYLRTVWFSALIFAPGREIFVSPSPAPVCGLFGFPL